MKFKVHIIFSLLLTLGSVNAFAQIGIGTKTPAPSAALEVSSIANNKGILIPRLTAIQKDAIVSPAEGLLVYQTTAPIGFYYYSNTVWKLIVDQTDLDNKLASAKTYVDDKIAAATIADADATTKGKIQLAGDLGGTAAAPTVPGLVLKANTSDVTTALVLKANTSDLATVATSGSYNDLANKPNIPSAYVIPNASASVLGGVKVGTGLSIDGNGILSAAVSGSTNVSSVTGVLPIANGGTGQTTVPGILSTLGFASNNVAIGNVAGTPNQGVNAGTIAIGGGAGRGNQGAASVAIGYVSGDQNQGANSISIGGNAAQGNQGTQSVAIGFAAGQNVQGANSVAIGTFAGQSDQAANSIAINATGTSTPLNPTTTGFFVDPIINRTATSTALYYNTTTKEITSGTAASTNLASSVSGTLPVANGGTGATTLTGLVKGSGTTALTAAVAGTDYQAPLTLTTTGTGAATFSGTTLNIPTPSSGGGSGGGDTHAIGDAYGGGIVFYVYDGGKHGLIAATADQSVQTSWSSSGGWTRAQANGVGAGLKNTTLIIGNSITLSPNTASYAATVCNEYSVTETVGGITTTYGDWYLPSKYELQLLYAQKSWFSGFTIGHYWSSNEWESVYNQNNVAWTVLFSDGQAHGYNKGQSTGFYTGGSQPIRARAIRAF